MFTESVWPHVQLEPNNTARLDSVTVALALRYVLYVSACASNSLGMYQIYIYRVVVSDLYLFSRLLIFCRFTRFSQNVHVLGTYRLSDNAIYKQQPAIIYAGSLHRVLLQAFCA